MRQGSRCIVATMTAIAVMALSVSGCKTLDAYTGQPEVSKTTKGAAIGAAAGAVVGMISGNDARSRRKKALILAGVGALAGGAVGQYMDRQEARLRERLAGTGVSVTRKGNDITLNMPGNITFDTDRSDVKPQFYGVLNSVSDVLKEFDKTIVEVAGHTDNVGAEPYNQQLSERRANSVAQYIEARGISAQRVMTVGAGETRPVADNATEQGRQLNRRVELTLEPLTQL